MNIDQTQFIMDLGSYKFRFSIINKALSKEVINTEENLFEIDYKGKIFSNNSNEVFQKIIKNSEKNIGLHITNLDIIADSKNLISIDLSIKKNFEGKNISNIDFEFLETDAKKLIEENYSNYIVIHSIIQKYFINDKEYKNFPSNDLNSNYLAITIKFLCFPKNTYQNIVSLLNHNHIELKSLRCSSFVKSKSYNSQFPSYNYKFFLDIGYEKTILNIYENDLLIKFYIIKIGGINITKDISKILNLEMTEAEKLKLNMNESDITFSDETDLKYSDKQDLLKKVIFARVEEIFNLIFENINFFDDIKNKKSLLVFTGEGSKILENNSIYLNKLFDSFDDIHYLEETSSKICMSLHKFCENEKIKNQKKPINLEIKTGFFEKMFNLLSKI